MQRIDLYGTGQLDYSGKIPLKFSLFIEFLLSTINLKNLVNKDKLRAVFKMFDVEQAGVITMEQVRTVLRRNGVKEAKNWGEMLKGAGKEGSSQMSFQDFYEMML